MFTVLNSIQDCTENGQEKIASKITTEHSCHVSHTQHYIGAPSFKRVQLNDEALRRKIKF